MKIYSNREFLFLFYRVQSNLFFILVFQLSSPERF